MNEQSRINAMISYFFLGPLFLLAKSGTPLHDPYIRGHAVRSSIIIGIAFLAYLTYAFLLRSWLDFSIFGFDIQNILLTILLSTTILLLLQWAYRAYSGTTAEAIKDLHMENIFHSESTITQIHHEDDKIRVIASMIPFLGIFIAEKYPHPIIVRGRVIGSASAFFIMITSLFSSEGGFLFSISIILSVLLFVILSVNVFIRWELILSGFLTKIPTYEELEAHIFASIMSIREFFRIAFGGEKRQDYHAFYIHEMTQRGEKIVPTQKYFMPAALIGLPVWNLFCIPSLWIEQYREYREYIISGIIITLLGVLAFLTTGNQYLLFLLFPIVHIFVYVSSDVSTYVPGIHILIRLFRIVWGFKKQIQEQNEQKTEAHFSYETPTEDIKK